MRRQPVRRRVAAPILALVVVCAGLAPPLLDASESHGQRHVESEHDPGTCGRLHDHAACTQLARSFSHIAAGWSPNAAEPIALRGERVAPRISLSFRAFSSAPSPRAPPSLHS